MAKNKAQTMAELDALEVPYDSKQTAKELTALLVKKQEEQEDDKEVEQEKPDRADGVEVKEVRLGLSTIQDHEARITVLEKLVAGK